MLWFFAFTTIGVGISLFLLLVKLAVRPSWRDWASNIAVFSLLAWLSMQ